MIVRSTVTAMVVAIFAGNASAAVSLVFDRLHAHPGDVVTARQPGKYGTPGERTRIFVYLIPVSVSARFRFSNGTMPGKPPAGYRKHFVGELRVTKDRVARVVFRVPKVAPGRYTTLVWCLPCMSPNGDYFPSVAGDMPDKYERHPSRAILRVRN